MTTLLFFTRFITKLVRSLSLSRVFVWAFTAFIVIFFYTIYENRADLLSSVTEPAQENMVASTFNVGQVSQQHLQDVVRAEPSIIGVSVFSTDLRLNEARTIYFFSDDAALNDSLGRLVQAGSTRLPIFTANIETNEQAIRIINGQFSCVPFESSLLAKIYPELQPSIKAICRTSIPSYYGYLSGYIEAYITEAPSPERELQYKLFIEKLANEIYFRDVAEAQRPERPLPEARRQGG